MALDPQKMALLVIDVQNEYFDGKWPIPEGIAALERIEQAIETSHSAGATVVYIQHAVANPDYGIFVPGSHGFDLHARLHPRTGDPRIVKNYPGSFSKTDLETTLRQRNIETLVITGYMTHMCCDTTAREGFQRDFRVLFLNDATGSCTSILRISLHPANEVVYHRLSRGEGKRYDRHSPCPGPPAASPPMAGGPPV